ncbi:hypothetical protein [Caldibacillus sp. 210928-DFI.2.22]|uniref:hypothetical protein n=1 Tax=Caldibacillus sp. 210928-DFI.2.22 TaxID=2883265 RepID=UPI001D08EA18|nr:hypothetical protein [Caldibacillus sp. 210928-DFI.2.22]
MTRLSLVAKKDHISPKNGDEIEARAKKDVFCLKMDIKGNPTRFILNIIHRELSLSKCTRHFHF